MTVAGKRRQPYSKEALIKLIESGGLSEKGTIIMCELGEKNPSSSGYEPTHYKGKALRRNGYVSENNEKIAEFGVSDIANISNNTYFGGEGVNHLELKRYISSAPTCVGLSESFKSHIEYKLPSGDQLDIIFKKDSEWVAVEVKSRTSSDADIGRGVFQCVKYHAVLEAISIVTGEPEYVSVILALETSLPKAYVPIVKKLGVTVIENISVT